MGLNRELSGRIRDGQETLNRCSTLLHIREMWIKTTSRLYFTKVRYDQHQVYKWEEKQFIHCWWERKLA